jgi:polyisoprenyl-teichoic acid--peptidoglycan teichoic acid transferase
MHDATFSREGVTARRAHLPQPKRRGRGRMALWSLLACLLALAWYSQPAWPLLARWAALPSFGGQPLTVLVAGASPKYAGYHLAAPEDFRGLADTMMLAQFNPQTKSVKLLSLPRDTRIRLAGYGWSKLNSALPRLGPAGIRQAVADLTGIRPDAILVISLAASRAAVDAVGGVSLTVPQRMQYRDSAAKLDIDLHPGLQRLSGREAEGFLRFRHDRLGDIGRVARQQAFVKAFLAQLRQPAGLLGLPQLGAALMRHTQTDLSRQQVAQISGLLLQRPQFATLMLPGDFGRLGGVSFWLPNQGEIAALVERELVK